MVEHIYIHIPFCLKKCSYCSFFSVRQDKESLQNYLQYLSAEIKLYSQELVLKPVSVYFGGGTPSLVDPFDIAKLLSLFDLSRLQECTIEVNPATVDQSKAEMLFRTPVNRVSIGFQSFDDTELQKLGRIHTSSDNYRTFEMFRQAGFTNISGDLIYGIPADTRSEAAKVEHPGKLQTAIKAIAELQPEHISSYCLSLEEGSPLLSADYSPLPDEMSEQQYRYLTEELNNMGIERYEISNYAKKGYESVHNTGYWKMKDYLGFGASAHSLYGNIRYANPAALDKYYENVRSGLLFPEKIEQSLQDAMNDYVIQGLRMTAGIDLQEFRQRFGEDFRVRYDKQLRKYAAYLLSNEKSVRLAAEAYFVSNEILAEFLG